MTNPFEIFDKRLSNIESLLLDMKHPKLESRKYTTAKQLSELTGWKITTVYQNHHNGLIPGATKVGNKLLFDTQTIHSWIEEGRKPTAAEKVKAIGG